MTTPISDQLETLRNAVEQRVPYCSGTVSAPAEALILFYGKETEARRLDLGNVSEESLTHLSRTCDSDPATFGLAKEDVYDESYRKAGKLDSTHFSVNIDLEGLGLVDRIRESLLRGPQFDVPVHAELYKLNVYGKGSFFKPHKDTPRSESMFGSLVLVFPTPHEAGSLVFRSNGREWTFDSAAAVRGSSPCIAFSAFFSDTEHEVLEVTLGYRVTITYNLYFRTPATSKIPAIVASDNTSIFKSVFSSLLLDATFLPDGGELTFGLHHEYPFTPDKKGTLDGLVQYLKGSDAVLYQTCEDLRLAVQPNLVYKDRDGWRVLTKKLPQFTYYDGVDHGSDVMEWLTSDDLGWKWIQRVDEDDIELERSDVDPDDETVKDGSRYIKSNGRWDTRKYLGDMRKRDKVYWVTDLANGLTFKSPYMAYGNQATLDFMYGQVCLLVKVGPFDAKESATLANIIMDW